MIKTVGELKKFLSDIDNSTPIVQMSENFEQYGAIVAGIYPKKEKMQEIEQTFCDAFDGTVYSKTVWEQCNWGTDVILM